MIITVLGATQVLRNAMGEGEWEDVTFLGKSVTKVYGSMLLALRGDGWVSIWSNHLLSQYETNTFISNTNQDQNIARAKHTDT